MARFRLYGAFWLYARLLEFYPQSVSRILLTECCNSMILPTERWRAAEQLSSSAAQELRSSAAQELSSSASQQLSNSGAQQLWSSAAQELSSSAAKQLRS